jgi:hypothetical protein
VSQHKKIARHGTRADRKPEPWIARCCRGMKPKLVHLCERHARAGLQKLAVVDPEFREYWFWIQAVVHREGLADSAGNAGQCRWFIKHSESKLTRSPLPVQAGVT